MVAGRMNGLPVIGMAPLCAMDGADAVARTA